MFHRHPRYDCAIIQRSASDFFFGRLLALFMLTVNGRGLSLAFVLPFEPIYTHRNRKVSDVELELLRLREMPTANAVFVSIYSIIRGAVLIQSGEEAPHRSSDFFLFDMLDSDMFLRSREILKRYAYDQFDDFDIILLIKIPGNVSSVYPLQTSEQDPHY